LWVIESLTGRLRFRDDDLAGRRRELRPVKTRLQIRQQAGEELFDTDCNATDCVRE